MKKKLKKKLILELQLICSLVFTLLIVFIENQYDTQALIGYCFFGMIFTYNFVIIDILNLRGERDV